MVVKVKSLQPSQRGKGGFGSTDKRPRMDYPPTEDPVTSDPVAPSPIKPPDTTIPNISSAEMDAMANDIHTILTISDSQTPHWIIKPFEQLQHSEKMNVWALIFKCAQISESQKSMIANGPHHALNFHAGVLNCAAPMSPQSITNQLQLSMTSKHKYVRHDLKS